MLFFYFKETLETNDSFVESSHRRQKYLRDWLKIREEALFQSTVYSWNIKEGIITEEKNLT